MSDSLIADIYQGEDEERIYSILTSAWVSNPVAEAVAAYDITNGDYVDVSSTVLSGSPSVLGDTITLPKISNLEKDHYYRIEIKFSSEGQVYEPYLLIRGVR